jgi:hypothetical protein
LTLKTGLSKDEIRMKHDTDQQTAALATYADKKVAHAMAIASSRIEGVGPTKKSIDEVNMVISGVATDDQLRAQWLKEMNNSVNRPQWTQDEAIAFECASECITDMMAIHTRRIADEMRNDFPDIDKLAEMRAARTRLAQERTTLHVHDHANIARIRTDYGAIVRAWRAGHHIIGA